MHLLDGFEILVRLDLPVKLPGTRGWIWGRRGGGTWLLLHKEQAQRETSFLAPAAESGEWQRVRRAPSGPESNQGAPFSHLAWGLLPRGALWLV